MDFFAKTKKREASVGCLGKPFEKGAFDIFDALRVLLHLLRRSFGGLNPFSGGTWTLREKGKSGFVC